ncbi:MAG: type II toxin-antitoxin system YoeB family toxin [Tannerellaceae bacterium]|nr:type II toxin-antitoxin system YoeB family toxin [Tannerellaceae bacterium]
MYKTTSRTCRTLMARGHHPEPLVSGNTVTYSRRINGKDRIIYDVYSETVSFMIL